MAEEKAKKKIEKLEFKVELELLDRFQFKVKYDFPEIPDLMTDEPIQMGGEGKGPNPSRMVGTAIANCLASSLIHCLRRSKADVKGIKADVKGYIKRNEEGLLRLTNVDVFLYPIMGSSDDMKAFERCKGLFEKYCVVTESIRQGLTVNVEVEPKINK
jgi:uncharacterized OsmC-like protein